MIQAMIFVLIALLAGCSSSPSKTADSLPEQLAGGLARQQVSEIPAGEVPEIVRNLGYRAGQRTLYTGPREVAVTLYEMSNTSGAFELAQKWKPEPGRLYFHQGTYFVVLESAAAEQKELNAMAGELEKALSGK